MIYNRRWGSDEGGAFTAAVGTKPHKRSLQDGVGARRDVSNISPLTSQGGGVGVGSGGDARTWDVRNPQIERLSDCIIQYSVSFYENNVKSDYIITCVLGSCVCARVRVCVRERERERERK